MKKIDRSSNFGADRYHYDFGECSAANGWAQLDSGQDASYFGTWINPVKRQILSYTEGDVCLVTVDTDTELVEEVQAIHDWNEKQGHRLANRIIGIDPGSNWDLKLSLQLAGLEKFLH